MSQEIITYHQFQSKYEKTHKHQSYKTRQSNVNRIWKQLKEKHKVSKSHKVTTKQYPSSFHKEAITISNQWTAEHLVRKSSGFNALFGIRPSTTNSNGNSSSHSSSNSSLHSSSNSSSHSPQKEQPPTNEPELASPPRKKAKTVPKKIHGDDASINLGTKIILFFYSIYKRIIICFYKKEFMMEIL